MQRRPNVKPQRGVPGDEGPTGPTGPTGPPGSGGSVAWGAVTGVLASQTDLATALAGKAATVHTHAPADVTGIAVITTDARLSDARTPTAHVHPQADVTGLVAALAGKAASVHTHAPGDITGIAVITTDSRLSDARAPTAHSHAPGDITGIAVVTSDGRLSDARTPLAHVHPQTDVTGLVAALAAKQDTLVSGTNIKTLNGVSVLGAGNLVLTPDLLLSTGPTNRTIATGYGAIVPDEYEIESTYEVTIETGAILEIT